MITKTEWPNIIHCFSGFSQKRKEKWEHIRQAGGLVATGCSSTVTNLIGSVSGAPKLS